MSEMVERVKQAIQDACAGCDPRDGSCFRDAAVAAIEAMRAPTGDMVCAGANHFAGTDDHSAYDAYAVSVDDMSDIWSAMIDEALKP